MTRFAILLGGELTATRRLRAQTKGARIIAADSGIAHAAVLGVSPELWVGDFDSAGSELAVQYAHIPRQAFPAEKDATDGAIAIAAAKVRGASSIVLVGGLGGQTDHTLGLIGQALRLAREGHHTVLTSGEEEAHPILPGKTTIDLPAGARLSIVPFSSLEGLDLEGVRWPLSKRHVGLGDTLTLSNITLGPVRIGLSAGSAIAIAYPPYD